MEQENFVKNSPRLVIEDYPRREVIKNLGVDIRIANIFPPFLELALFPLMDSDGCILRKCFFTLLHYQLSIPGYLRILEQYQKKMTYRKFSKALYSSMQDCDRVLGKMVKKIVDLHGEPKYGFGFTDVNMERLKKKILNFIEYLEWENKDDGSWDVENILASTNLVSGYEFDFWK